MLDSLILYDENISVESLLELPDDQFISMYFLHLPFDLYIDHTKQYICNIINHPEIISKAKKLLRKVPSTDTETLIVPPLISSSARNLWTKIITRQNKEFCYCRFTDAKRIHGSNLITQVKYVSEISVDEILENLDLVRELLSNNKCKYNEQIFIEAFKRSEKEGQELIFYAIIQRITSEHIDSSSVENLKNLYLTALSIGREDLTFGMISNRSIVAYITEVVPERLITKSIKICHRHDRVYFLLNKSTSKCNDFLKVLKSTLARNYLPFSGIQSFSIELSNEIIDKLNLPLLINLFRHYVSDDGDSIFDFDHQYLLKKIMPYLLIKPTDTKKLTLYVEKRNSQKGDKKIIK